MAHPSSGYAFVGHENLRNDIYPAISASSNLQLQQTGKTVLITGAGRGIGRAIALQYAYASVAAIVLCARTATELDEVHERIKEISPDIRVLKRQVDVTDNRAVAALAQEIKSKEGRLDVLVNNAGASPAWVSISDSDASDWWTCMEINVKGPYLFLQAFLPLLLETAGKERTAVDVINMSSIGAHQVVPTSSAYGISKLAVLRLTDFVNAEYGTRGINAVSVHPGGVATQLASSVEAIQPYLIDTPELCGGFVVWLTANSRTWLAGRYVSATWDVDVLQSMKDEIVAGDKLKVSMVV